MIQISLWTILNFRNDAKPDHDFEPNQSTD